MSKRRLLALAAAGMVVAGGALAPSAAGDPSPDLTNSDKVELVCNNGSSTYTAIHNYQAGYSENFFVVGDSRVFIAVSLGLPGEVPFFYVKGFTKNGQDLLTCTVVKRGTTVVVIGYFTPATR